MTSNVTKNTPSNAGILNNVELEYPRVLANTGKTMNKSALRNCETRLHLRSLTTATAGARAYFYGALHGLCAEKADEEMDRDFLLNSANFWQRFGHF